MRPSDESTVGYEGPALGLPARTGALPGTPELPVEHQQLGRFQIVRKLGAGGMGVVYEAIDTDDGSRVALKTLRAVTPRGAQRFKQEFRALADLSHENVVELRELHATDERLYFTMELIHGTDLLRWVLAPGSATAWTHDDQEERTGPDYGRLTDALRGLVLGVDAVHQHGKLHRDLKPSNVLVTDQGRVVVLDFGLVRDAGHDAPGGLTMSGMVMGTPAYMSPEQADGRTLGPASDWYALGVILYEALTGQMPHAGSASDVGVLVAKATLPAPDPRRVSPQVPAMLAELCMALLARNPADRPGASAILAALPAGRDGAAQAPSRVASPLLGRDAALATLHAAYNAASLGRTVVALVQGPSGIGKSALTDHFVRSLQRRNGDAVVVLRGRCYERESVPYKALDPLVDHLTRYLRRLPVADAAALLPREVHALSRLFPALLDVPAIDRAPRRAPLEPQELRQRAVLALQELLGRIADRRPLVLHIDDLQWSDDDSAALLLELLRPPDAPHLLLIGAFRQEDAAAEGTPALLRLLEGLAATRPKLEIHRITVGPLAPKHAAMLARVLLGEHGLPHAMAERLAAECEGNPLFAGELVRHLAATATAQGCVPEALASPRLTEVLRDRIQGLAAPARRVLQAVAIAGRRLPVAVAVQAAGNSGDGADPVARLRAEHFVRTVGPAAARFIESYHDRIRQAAVDSMTPTDRAQTHAALAQALQARPDADPEDLLVHYRAAGDDARAGEFAVAAAKRAASQLAFEHAAELWALALQLHASDTASLHRHHGEALANAGHGHLAARAFLDAARLEDGARRVELQRRAASQLLLAGYNDEGRAELAHVLAARKLAVPRSRRAAIAGLMLRRARLKLRGMAWTQDDNVDPAILARLDACWAAARGLVITDIFEGGYFQAEHLLLALACGDPPRVAAALAEEAKGASYFGDRGLARARALLQQVNALAARIDTPQARASAIAAEALVALMSAQWSASLAKNLEAEALLRDTCTGVHQEIFDTMAGQAAALYAMGDIAGLQAVCRRTARDATQRSNLYHATMSRLFLAVPVALTYDEPAAATAALIETTALCRERGIQVAEIQIFNARCALGIYTDTAAATLAEQQAAFEAMASNPLLRASFANTEVTSWHGRLALAAAARASGSQRESLLVPARRAAKALLRQSFPTAPPMGRLLRAGVAALEGDPERAQIDLRDAADRFEALQMASWTAAARRRLGTLLGGDRGFIVVGRAEATMTLAGVKNLDAFSNLWAPGFSA